MIKFLCFKVKNIKDCFVGILWDGLHGWWMDCCAKKDWRSDWLQTSLVRLCEWIWTSARSAHHILWKLVPSLNKLQPHAFLLIFKFTLGRGTLAWFKEDIQYCQPETQCLPTPYCPSITRWYHLICLLWQILDRRRGHLLQNTSWEICWQCRYSNTMYSLAPKLHYMKLQNITF